MPLPRTKPGEDAQTQVHGDLADETPYIAIGIDLGTTFSGVAWCLSTAPKDVHVISAWDGEGRNYDSDKVATCLLYEESGTFAGWGFADVPKSQKVSWFKLLLCREGRTHSSSAMLDKAELSLNRLQKSPLQVVTDYLNHLWLHALKVLQKKLGEALFRNLTIRLVITVPAIWDHAAQALTRKAATTALLLAREKTQFFLLGEPEAAAIAVFNDASVHGADSLKVGDSFVICDAGGGTVDLISYKIEGLSPLSLAMCTESTGGLHGAVFLDRAFEGRVKELLSTKMFKNLDERKKKKMMEEWEHGIKRSFKYKEDADKTWTIDIPGSIKSLTFTTSDLIKIFDTVVPDIITLVLEQIAAVELRTGAGPKAIFLVGGLGENQYLHQSLCDRIPDVETRQPTKSWSAICRGAAIHGLNTTTVQNHISNLNYGIRYQTVFIPGIHDSRDMIYSPREGRFVADNQLKWYLKKGDDIQNSAVVKHKWETHLPVQSSLSDLTQTIYVSKRVDPPKTSSENAADATKLCDIVTTFEPNLWNRLPVVTGHDGLRYRRLDFSIVMKVTSGNLQWSILRNGQESGSLRIDINYQSVSQADK